MIASFKRRRDSLTARGLYLNGEKHGTAMPGRRCAKCRETHRRSR